MSNIIPKEEYVESLEQEVANAMAAIKADKSISKIKRFDRKVNRVKTPEFKSKSEESQWWTEEAKRWVSGGNGLSGIMYAWYNYARIKDIKKGLINVDFLSSQNTLFDIVFECIANNEGLVSVKRRRYGASWLFAFLCLYLAMTRRYFNIGMNSKSDEDSEELFKKVKHLYYNLPPQLRVSVSRVTSDRMEFSKESKDKSGAKVVEGNQSYIIVKPPVVTAFEGQSLNMWISDECGKQPNLKNMYSMTEPCLMDGPVRAGTPCLFGTAGDINKDASGLREIWYNSESYNMRKFFIGGYMGLIVDEYGNDNIEESVRWIVYERKKREGRGKKEYIDFIQQYPLTPKEAFTPFVSGGLGNPLRINNHKVSLHDNPVKEVTGIFKLKDGKPEFVPKPHGPVKIYEHPKEGMKALAGCLPPGEKVLTDSGLKSIEDVDFNDKLISKDGDQVAIKELQQYDVDDDLFTLKIKNTYRKTRFTSEHPIYVSDNVKGYTSFKKKKREGLKYSHQKFDFRFKPVSEVKKFDWIKFPNVYKKTKPINPNLWAKTKKYDLDIDIPFEDVDFWWFVGVWLGDGWVENNGKISISCNKKETVHIEKVKRVVEKLFNRTHSDNKETETCVTIQFTSIQLDRFLTKNFGKYSYGKTIPEWFKFSSEEYKKALVSGYIDSDGCVMQDKRRNLYSSEIVSVNLELLEHVQDILFSVGFISSTSLLREAGSDKIRGVEIQQRKAYRLRMGHYWLSKFKEECTDSVKVNSLPGLKPNRCNNMGCFFSEGKEYIYFQIIEITKEKFKGLVYNFHCETSTYLCKNITTHNCDPADHDNVNPNETSKLSTVVMRKPVGLEPAKIVCIYEDRPDNLNEYFNQTKWILDYYDCQALIERNRPRMINYFEENKWYDKMIPEPQMARVYQSRPSRFGVHMTPQRKSEMEGYIEAYLEDATEWIPSIQLLDELLVYGAENTDTLMAFGICLLAMYSDKTKSRDTQEMSKYVPTFRFVKQNGRIIRQSA